MSVLFLLLLTCSTLLVRAQEGCQKSPLWLFFRHEDVKTIYPSLPGWSADSARFYIFKTCLSLFPDVFVLVDGGKVNQLVTTPNPVAAELIFLGTDVAEFPINWCISSDQFEVIFNNTHTIFFLDSYLLQKSAFG